MTALPTWDAQMEALKGGADACDGLSHLVVFALELDLRQAHPLLAVRGCSEHPEGIYAITNTDRIDQHSQLCDALLDGLFEESGEIVLLDHRQVGDRLPHVLIKTSESAGKGVEDIIGAVIGSLEA